MNPPKIRILVFAALLIAGIASFPQAAFAAEQGNKWGVWLYAGRFFNLLLVAGVLAWVLKKPLSEFFAQRSRAIREQLVEAQEARRMAEAKAAEMEARMGRLDDELREIRQAAEKEAQQEYVRLNAASREAADKISERARQEIDGLTRAAQKELKAHAAELSVRLAEEIVRNEINDSDRGRIFAKFVDRLGREQ